MALPPTHKFIGAQFSHLEPQSPPSCSLPSTGAIFALKMKTENMKHSHEHMGHKEVLGVGFLMPTNMEGEEKSSHERKPPPKKKQTGSGVVWTACTVGSSWRGAGGGGLL